MPNKFLAGILISQSQTIPGFPSNFFWHILLFSIFIIHCDAQSQWNHLDEGFIGNVWEITIDGSDVYVGGDFTDAGGNADADYLARWDGCQWHAVAPGINGGVIAITINGTDLYVGGVFTQPFPSIAKWNGIEWVSLGPGLNEQVNSIVLQDGDLYAGGGTYNSGFVSRWNGNEWTTLATLDGIVVDMVIHESTLYVGGNFTDGGGNPLADGIMKWTDNAWENLAGGIQEAVIDVLSYEGNLYVGGLFFDVGGNTAADHVIFWDGVQWNALGNGPPGVLGYYKLNIFDDALYTTVGAGWSYPSQDGVYRWDFEDQVWEIFQIMELGADDPLTIIESDAESIYIGSISGFVADGEYYYPIGRWGPPSHGVVTSLIDGSVGSLRNIIRCTPEGEAITFALETPAEIPLTSGEILIEKNVTIDGPGMDMLSISANNTSRIFQVQQNKHLTLKDITLKNSTAMSNGGAIYAQGHLTLENVILKNNFQDGIPKSLTISPGIQLRIKNNVELKF